MVVTTAKSWNSLISDQYTKRVGRRGTGVGWVVVKAKTKKQDDTNGRV